MLYISQKITKKINFKIKNHLLFTICFSLLVLNTDFIYSQSTGETDIFKTDSLITFESPRPLIDTMIAMDKYKSAIGGHLIFSTNGFGFGGLYEYKLEKDLTLLVDLFLGGARNTDEFEVFDQNTGQTFVQYKLNRLFNFPLTIGLSKYLFQDVLVDNFKPFINGGIGFSTLLSNPYASYPNGDPNAQVNIDFFSALKFTDAYIRPAGFIGVGADFGFNKKNLSRLQIRYYYIPFLGGNQKDEFGNDLVDENNKPIPKGLYSMLPLVADPISNFGGLFISLSIGTKF